MHASTARPTATNTTYLTSIHQNNYILVPMHVFVRMRFFGNAGVHYSCVLSSSLRGNLNNLATYPGSECLYTTGLRGDAVTNKPFMKTENHAK